MKRRTWTEATIEAELTAVVATLGRFPKRAELIDRGLGGLWTAMQRNGGVPAWRDRLAAPAAPEPRAVAHEDIARRAYFLAQERGGDPVANWLLAERELRAA
ncbi:MAG TPA: DUF2934 domain-containing protein [Solirubrobacteraceae bacterium]|nr:DUF2934 domain-containing protein [Solirubrobacteraceae bacterium]